MKKSDLKNGMIVTLRRGAERVIIGRFLFNEEGTIISKLENYNDDLTHMNNCKSEDIMKIIHGDKIIWERKVDWSEVPFGTKVRAWWEDSKVKYTGRFLAYDDDNTELPFFVFIEHAKDTNWYDHCEIIEEGEDE